MNEHKRVMIVGAGWDQVPIIQEAKRQGHFVVALDGNPNACGLKYADKARIVSTRDVEGVLAAAQAEKIDAITYMITESPLYAIRHVVEALGLPGPSEKSVAATVSKVRMREIFEEARMPNPGFGKATTLPEAQTLASKIGLPLVMKPADVGGQLGLFKITDFDQIDEHFAESQAESVDGTVILEEWLAGYEVNVVAIVVSGKIRTMTVSDRIKHPSGAFGIVARHLYPAQCTPKDLIRIQEICESAASAMEIHTGIVFPQLIVTATGPRIVETGERIPGGVMKELFELVTGYDLVKFQLDIALGKCMDSLETYRNHPGYRAVTVKFLTAEPGSLRPGRVVSMTGRSEVLALPGIVAAEYYNTPMAPQEIIPLRNARGRFFFLIGVGETREEVIALTDSASKRLNFLDKNGESLNLEYAI
ncbi:MAG: ATP-grasp domain-containing protein [Anaerolineae bacterium]|nr:ATP-grasp domain-containing protein [Anaerolineae bacterium]